MAKTLEERIQRLEDIRAVEQLFYAYEAYMDDNYNAEPLADLFTPDGVWEIKGVGGYAKGRDAIINHCNNCRASIPWAQHNMVAPRVELAEDGQSAVSRFCLIANVTMTDENGVPDAYILTGKYENKCVKIDGKWYFEALTGVIEQSAPWDKGWVKAPMSRDL